MLNPNGRTPYPDWVNPYTAYWEEGQWIVILPDEHSAMQAWHTIANNPGAPRLAVAPMPDGSNYWYVGVVD